MFSNDLRLDGEDRARGREIATDDARAGDGDFLECGLIRGASAVCSAPARAAATAVAIERA